MEPKNTKAGDRVDGWVGSPMGWGYGGQIGQNSPPDGGGCKKGRKSKMLIFLARIGLN